MASTYTPKLNLAKPAHGDVNWHIPINGNWDKIDTELDKALKISGTTIDANKNWNGKNISNVGQLQANSVTTTTLQANSVTTTTYTLIPDPCIWYQDNTFKQTDSASYTVLKTAKAVPAGFSGTVSVHYNVDSYSCEYAAFAQLRKNGSAVQSHVQFSDLNVKYIDNVAVSPGDVISLALYPDRVYPETSAGYVKTELFEIRGLPLLAGTSVLPPW
jgi:hypothetical protein